MPRARVPGTIGGMPGATSSTELQRLIENLVRAGTVLAVDHTTARCRVQTGAIQTNWLPWFSRRAGDVRHWSPPSVGEQCIILSPGGDIASGMVMVGLFSDAVPANGDSPDIERTTYPDGGVVEYDHAAHALKATLPAGGTADITAPASVTVHSAAIELDAPQTTVTGMLTVQGLFTWLAGMVGSGAAPGGGTAEINGSISTTGDVVAGGISLMHHDHAEGVGSPT